MRSEEIIQEVNSFGLAAKLLLVEDLWDSIALSNSTLPLPKWQKKELDKRYEEYKTGKLELHDWEFIHNTLREVAS
jgi:putative addiction module component (TIGR02574 family)